jgi:acyl-CoA synthetase (NDP forming)
MTSALADIVEKWARQGTKPMTVCCVGGSYPLPVMKRLDNAGIPTYGTIKRSVFALSCLRERGRFLERVSRESKEGFSPTKA